MVPAASPQAIFHLIPENEAAREALNHTDNSRFVSISPRQEKLGLEVGFHVASVPGRVMARLGRNADLILQRRSVSAVHVSFEIHPDTLVVLLSVRTKRTRPVLVRPKNGLAESVDGDCVLGYGTEYELEIGEYIFGLVWRSEDPLFLRELTHREYAQALERQALVNAPSRFLPTEDDSEALTWHNTRIHTIQRPLFREAKGATRTRIGGGQFGEVYRAVDDQTGHPFAVKVILLHRYPDPEDARARAHQEAKALQRLKHVCHTPFPLVLLPRHQPADSSCRRISSIFFTPQNLTPTSPRFLCHCAWGV